MNKLHNLRLSGIAFLSVILLNLFSCRNNDVPLSLDCIIEAVKDNMPSQDDDYVNSFSIYPRRLRLRCSIKNTSKKKVSIPFKTMLDTISSSSFIVTINRSDRVPIIVEQLGFNDKFSIKPNEIIKIEICSIIFKCENGKYGKMPLQDLLRLINVKYEKDSNDKSLSDNEMANVNFIWDQNLHIICEEKGNRNNRCGP